MAATKCALSGTPQSMSWKGHMVDPAAIERVVSLYLDEEKKRKKHEGVFQTGKDEKGQLETALGFDVWVLLFKD